MDDLTNFGLFDASMRAEIKRIKGDTFEECDVIDNDSGERVTVLGLTSGNGGDTDGSAGNNLQKALQMAALSTTRELMRRLIDGEMKTAEVLQLQKVALQYGYGNASGIWDPSGDNAKAAKAVIDLSPTFRDILGK